MTNALSKIASALLAVLLLYLFPAVQTAQREADIRYMSAYHALTEFADAVRTKGYISPVMYEQFTRSLEAKGNLYDIELEHRHKNITPNTAIRPTRTRFKTGLASFTTPITPRIS